MNVLNKRIRKSTKIRKKIKQLNIARLSVHRTPRHIYAQVIGVDGRVLTSASSLEKTIKLDTTVKVNNNLQEITSSSQQNSTTKVNVAKLVGKLLAERCQGKINKVAFDRSGFKYHGRIKALADAARENGLSF